MIIFSQTDKKDFHENKKITTTIFPVKEIDLIFFFGVDYSLHYQRS